ncbi:hypothetical protein MVEN_00865800 [Mycena venus]|uniref:Uncharacterized protein n=1 Tax=Mycena venus TaxID=2733690 RepID=A0A8H6YH55_9AGAR|nr:hypothetical protein MVEN_00865800 [Mycena venus]
MAASVKDLVLIFQLFFPRDLSSARALHANQRREPRQPARTGWFKTVKTLLVRAFSEESNDVAAWTSGLGGDRAEEYAESLCRDLDKLYLLLGLPEGTKFSQSAFDFRRAKPILTTARLNCTFCPPGDSNLVPTLHRRRWDKIQTVWLLDSSFHWVEATLITYTSPPGTHSRWERLEYDPEFLRISKHGIWVHKQIAQTQENALHQFHSGWSNFADWRLFLEHFSRRLLVAHNKDTTFRCEAHPSSRLLAEEVHRTIGINGGVLPSSMSHGCTGCTRVKRYHSDLIGEGAVLGSNTEVANTSGAEAAGDQIQTDLGDLAPLPANLPDSLPQLEAPPVGSLRGYIQMAVMDGKGIKHRQEVGEGSIQAPQGPSLRVQLQALGNTPGGDVIHTFKAKSIYCLQTVQWACGVPIGWGKCYRSESAPQVLRFLNNTWADYPNSRPSFLAYDNACNLLRHIVTQDPSDIWLATTKFIVDAWHYIGHQATDILCRTRCNPAPTDGSQPDLVLTEADDNGQVHQTRAFNTETAEQLNSWLNGFESQLRQMSDVNYDFFIHVLMLIYAETMEKRIQLKEMELTEEFWDRVNGLA